MTISKRIRERAAEVIDRAIELAHKHSDDDPHADARVFELSIVRRLILSIPDDPEEGAIRAAAMEYAAQQCEHMASVTRSEPRDVAEGSFLVAAAAIRALAPAPSGWVCVKSDDLDDLIDQSGYAPQWALDKHGDARELPSIRAALQEDPND